MTAMEGFWARVDPGGQDARGVRLRLCVGVVLSCFFF